MAVGDVKSKIINLAAGQRYDIRPPSGEEWVLHNIYYTSNVDFIMTDGTNVVTFDRDTSQGARLGMVTHITNSYWIQVYNYTAGTALTFAYDGIQTK